MAFENRADVFTAHLFVNGAPLVLNQQYMERRLLDPRIPARERLDTEAALVDSALPRLVTLAAHDDDEPLLFQFVPEGNKTYAVYTKLSGKYDGWRLSMDSVIRHWIVSEATQSLFSLVGEAGERVTFKRSSPGVAYVLVVSEEKQASLHLAKTNYRDKHKSGTGHRTIFVDVNPNITGHDAFNKPPVTFVLKLVDKPVVDD